jgi:DNA repair protein RadD
MPLRDYQQEALDALENYIAIEDGNPLVVMPTGSGKSHVIADFVLHMNEQKKQKTLIVSHVKGNTCFKITRSCKMLGRMEI